jgi:hypothetical protein
MKIALCTSDFYAPVHQSIKQTGHEVSHVFTSCELDTGWSLQTAEFAREMRAKFTVGRVTEAEIQEIQHDGVDLLISAAYDYKVGEFGACNLCGHDGSHTIPHPPQWNTASLCARISPAWGNDGLIDDNVFLGGD